MTRMKIFLLALLILGFVQCKPKKDPNRTYFENAGKYNDFIYQEQQAVMNSFEVFAAAVNKNNPDSIRISYDAMTKRASESRSSVFKLAPFKGDTMFRYAALDFFDFVNAACNQELKEIRDLSTKDSVTEEDVKRINELSEVYTIQEKEKNQALIAAQEKFCQAFYVDLKN